MANKEMIIRQVTSGRWILTVIGGFVFAYCSCKKNIEPQAITSILTAIFMSYFQRSDRQVENKPEVEPKKEGA